MAIIDPPSGLDNRKFVGERKIMGKMEIE